MICQFTLDPDFRSLTLDDHYMKGCFPVVISYCTRCVHIVYG